MKLFNCSIARSAVALAALSLPLAAQTSLNSLSAVVRVTPPEKIVAKRNQVVRVDFLIEVKDGFHVNSNTPEDEYLIPLKFTWAEDVAKVQEIIYPKPQLERFQFSAKPVSVFQGGIKAQARFKFGGSVPTGLSHLTGKLRYQACNDRLCLPPRTLDIRVPVEIRN